MYRGFEHVSLALLEYPKDQSPLFFLIFINDIERRVMHSKVLLYADDLKIFQPIRSAEDSVHLQKDLDTLVQWSERSRLPFNMTKGEKISFTMLRTGEVGRLRYGVPISNVRRERPHSLHPRSPVEHSSR